ncbi:hypothetical protein HYT23_02705 [Candidatus Pacearchaeota archaeon]|nr:hypothetical protein [Candidatus Pacearchaeota archaeon]
MANEEYDYQAYYDINTKIRDLEEKNRILKDRVLIIGQNLVDMRERTSEDILEIRKQLEEIKFSMEKIKRFLESFSEEFSKFAKKEDLDILIKQAKMFQPLEFVRKSDLEKLKKK